jgi:hypothetical protein
VQQNRAGVPSLHPIDALPVAETQYRQFSFLGVQMATIAEELQPLWEHNKQFFGVEARKITVQQVGSHYKAFFVGDARNATLGDTPQHAIKKLKMWEKYDNA